MGMGMTISDAIVRVMGWHAAVALAMPAHYKMRMVSLYPDVRFSRTQAIPA